MARVSAPTDETEVDSPDSKPADEPEKSLSSSAPSKIGFFQQLSAYTPAEWESLMVYVYRTSPITDRRATGNPTTYVMKYVGPFDEDRLKLDAGSGGYQLRLNQSNARGNSKTIRTFICDIEDINFPPKVPDGEWIDDPKNKRWEWARKKKPEAEAAVTTGDSGAVRELSNIVSKLMAERAAGKPESEAEKKVSNVLIDWALKQTASDKESNSPGQLANLVKAVKDLMPAAAKPDDSGMATVVGLLTRMLETSDKRAEQYAKDAAEERKNAQAERQRQHELELKRMEQKQGGGQGDMLEVVDRVLGIKERLMEDSEPRRKVDWKEELVTQGLSYVPQLIDLGKAALTYRADPRAVQQPVQQQQTQPTTGATTTTVQNAQNQPIVPQQVQIDPEIERILPTLMNYGPAMVGIFRNNPNGHAFADQMIQATSEALYEGIRAMGPLKLMAAVQLIPQMYEDLLAVSGGNSALLQQFLTEFCEGPEEDDPDEPEIPEAVRTGGPKKPKAGKGTGVV